MDFLKTIVRTRSQEVENSSFTILAPDGRTQLVQSGRSMRNAFRSPTDMAKGLTDILAKHEPKAAVSTLPLVTDVRLALDVASSDNQPLVIITAQGSDRDVWTEAVRKLAWSNEFIGRFVYVQANDVSELKNVPDVKADAKVVVVQADRYGTKGTVLAQTASMNTLAATLTDGASIFVRIEKEFRAHTRAGHQEGVYWETKTPVTDPMERAARERGRR